MAGSWHRSRLLPTAKMAYTLDHRPAMSCSLRAHHHCHERRQKHRRATVFEPVVTLWFTFHTKVRMFGHTATEAIEYCPFVAPAGNTSDKLVQTIV